MGTKKKATQGSIDATNTVGSTIQSSNSGSSAYASLTFNDVLEDLSSRFIVNLPAEEQASIHRICFQVEQAHWFYEDFLRPLNPSLPSFALRRFSSYLLHTAALTVPLIQRYISNSSNHESQQGLEAAFDEFLKYKTRVPVCGAVMLNTKLNKCILVKGWKSNSTWGFPKGKINQQETERDCAVREVLEETGFDCGPLLPTDSRDFMELTMREQKIRLYIVPGLDENTYFETQTRKEISKISWFNLSDLPTWKKNKAPPQGMGGKFYLISPFIGKLKQWIQENRSRYVHSSQGVIDVDDEVDITNSVIVEGADEKSNDLKALLGLSAPIEPVQTQTVDGKGPRMIDEQGDERGKQLLELLRGGPSVASAHVPGQPKLNFGEDEREGGTASLLAALNAGSGNLNGAGQAQNVSTGPSALLSLLNGTAGTIRDIPQSSTPLPAPRAQRTAEAQNLLNMISPSTSMSLPTTQQPPSSAQPNVSVDAVSHLGIEEQKERDRAVKRDLLLSSLMSSSMQIQEPAPPPQMLPQGQAIQHHQNAFEQDQKVRQFRFPPQSPPSHSSASQSSPGHLLSLLNGPQGQYQQSQPSTSPFSAFVQQSTAQQSPYHPHPSAPPPPPPSMHAASQQPPVNPLMSILNGNPMPNVGGQNETRQLNQSAQQYAPSAAHVPYLPPLMPYSTPSSGPPPLGHSMPLLHSPQSGPITSPHQPFSPTQQSHLQAVNGHPQSQPLPPLPFPPYGYPGLPSSYAPQHNQYANANAYPAPPPQSGLPPHQPPLPL